MNKTGIEYLDFSWNPIAMRCTPISPGCAHCWHLKMANRLAGNTSMSEEIRAAHRGDISPLLVERRLQEPLKRKKNARIGVQFMGDLFHDDVSIVDIGKILNTIYKSKQHTFLILTKRPDRAFQIFGYYYRSFCNEPFKNLWLGVSISTQDELWKVAELLKIPAAVRFVSVEPMLEAIDLDAVPVPGMEGITASALQYSRNSFMHVHPDYRIKWVICGAETGPGKRPMQLDWARSLRDQCQAADVPFFFKRDSDGNRELDGRLWNNTSHRRR